jgi:hypothetical protein
MCICQNYIEGIMALSGCFETVVLILIGDPVESRAIIRRIHLALINTPVELILRTCQNTTELSSLIRVVVDESIRRREERMTYDQVSQSQPLGPWMHGGDQKST